MERNKNDQRASGQALMQPALQQMQGTELMDAALKHGAMLLQPGGVGTSGSASYFFLPDEMGSVADDTATSPHTLTYYL